MRDAWQILRDGGLPLATERTGLPTTAAELAAATREAITTGPVGRDAEALAAFVLAWHHHWPTTFNTELGTDVPAVLDWASRNTNDANRYLKLRRIALENLARVI
jgi:hypothetical protein